MNEKLREFAEQAHKLATAENRYYGLLEYSEKFAELIVRECAEKFAAEPDRPFYGRHVSYHIKKHFGVEE